MQGLSLGIPTRQSELDLPPSDDVRINETAPVMRAADDSIELMPMNFSFPPSGARGGPLFNFRSEGRHGNHPPAFTMLTTAPGPDVAPYHNRQVVVL